MTAATILLALTLAFFGNPTAQPGFLGLLVGMKTPSALLIVSKNADALAHVKMRSGQRIISDTIPISDCELSMKRSLGFDSTNTLTAVGLTYKTTPDHIADARDCAFQWLQKKYGHPTFESVTDSITQEIWQYDGVKLTLEAKQYNPHDVFVLIYYYKADK
jgi:hypothetical protein